MKVQAKPTFLICHLPLIEPTAQTEGIHAVGLGTTDIGNKTAMDGISRGFYPNILKYYDQAENWKWQKRNDYKDGAQARTEAGEEATRIFDPSATTDLKNPYESLDIAEDPLV